MKKKILNIAFRLLSGLVASLYTMAIVVCIGIIFKCQDYFTDTMIFLSILLLTATGFISMIQVALFLWGEAFSKEEN